MHMLIHLLSVARRMNVTILFMIQCSIDLVVENCLDLNVFILLVMRM